MYVALMDRVRYFVLADTFQYSRQSFQNRTRLRNSRKAQWITVPLEGGQHGRSQAATRIRTGTAWRRRHWKAFRYNYGRAPYFVHYEAPLVDFFEAEYARLAEATCASVRLIHRLFGLDTVLSRATDMQGQPDAMASVLLPFPGRAVFLPPVAACIDRRLHTRIRAFEYTHPKYPQAFPGFVPGMTALDLLFNCGPDSLAVLRQGISAPE